MKLNVLTLLVLSICFHTAAYGEDEEDCNGGFKDGVEMSFALDEVPLFTEFMPSSPGLWTQDISELSMSEKFKLEIQQNKMLREAAETIIKVVFDEAPEEEILKELEALQKNEKLDFISVEELIQHIDKTQIDFESLAYIMVHLFHPKNDLTPDNRYLIAEQMIKTGFSKNQSMQALGVATYLWQMMRTPKTADKYFLKVQDFLSIMYKREGTLAFKGLAKDSNNFYAELIVSYSLHRFKLNSDALYKDHLKKIRNNRSLLIYMGTDLLFHKMRFSGVVEEFEIKAFIKLVLGNPEHQAYQNEFMSILREKPSLLNEPVMIEKDGKKIEQGNIALYNAIKESGKLRNFISSVFE